MDQSLLEIQDRFLNYASFIIENPHVSSAKEFLLLGQTDASAGAILPILKAAKLCRSRHPSGDFLRKHSDHRGMARWKLKKRVPARLAHSELRSEQRTGSDEIFLGPAVPDLADWKIGFRPAEYRTLSPVAADAGLRYWRSKSMFPIYTFTPVEGAADYLIKAKLALIRSVPDVVGHKSEWDWVDASGKKFKQLRLIQLLQRRLWGRAESACSAPSSLKRRLRSNSVFLVFRQAKEDWIELHASRLAEAASD